MLSQSLFSSHQLLPNAGVVRKTMNDLFDFTQPWERSTSLMSILFKSFFILTIFLTFPNVLFAAADAATKTNPSTMGAAFWITFFIVYFSRKKAIGGWLLYYYVQLYISIFVSVAILFTSLNNFKPSSWEDISLYPFYLVSVVPSYLLFVVQLFLSTKLLFIKYRNINNLKILRMIMVVTVAFDVIGLAIDIKHFSDNVFLSVYSLIISIIWCAYFYVSKRVNAVFIENKWEYIEKPVEILSPEEIIEKKKVQKKVLLFTAIVFALIFVLMVLSDNDFYESILFSIIYSLLIGAVGLYIMSRKKKTKHIVDSHENLKNNDEVNTVK